jgi:hypothetical protein
MLDAVGWKLLTAIAIPAIGAAASRAANGALADSNVGSSQSSGPFSSAHLALALPALGARGAFAGPDCAVARLYSRFTAALAGLGDRALFRVFARMERSPPGQDNRLRTSKLFACPSN